MRGFSIAWCLSQGYLLNNEITNYLLIVVCKIAKGKLISSEITSVATAASGSVKTSSFGLWLVSSWFCNGNLDGLAIIICLVQFFNCFIGFFFVIHFNKAKTS